MSFEPVLLAFNCNWCSYAAADLAGTARMQYPPNIRIIRVMCSGMVHQNLIEQAFQLGADGVMVMGCHPGECHYLDGNEKAQGRMPIIEEIMDMLGLEKERFAMVWCSSAEPDVFVEAVGEMTETLRGLGPSALRTNAAPPGPPAFTCTAPLFKGEEETKTCRSR